MGFLLLEWLRPGFVTDVFSPHVFLAAALVFGVLWGWNWDWGLGLEVGIREKAVALVLGTMLARVVWTEGRALEEFRILTVIAAFFVPFFLLTIFRPNS